MTDNVQTPGPDTPTINLVDLRNYLRIIDVAAERGAFRGDELSSVGGVRDKLSAFLNAVDPIEEQGAEAPSEAPAEAAISEEPAPAPKKKAAPAKKAASSKKKASTKG